MFYESRHRKIGFLKQYRQLKAGRDEKGGCLVTSTVHCLVPGYRSATFDSAIRRDTSAASVSPSVGLTR